MPTASQNNRLKATSQHQPRPTHTTVPANNSPFPPQISYKNMNSTRKSVSKQKTTDTRKLRNVSQKRLNDTNESILTQYSHATCRHSTNKHKANRSFDVTITSAGDLNSTSTEDCFSETEEEYHSLSNPDHQGTRHDRKSLPEVTKRSTPPVFKIPHNAKSTKSPVELYDWVIRPLPDVKGVCVEGQKKDMDDFWHSSAVLSVKRRKFVKTTSGTVYRLKGKLNKLSTLDTGFSKDVVSAFANGFPADWLEVINKFYSNLEHSISINDECSIVRGYSLKRFSGMQKKTAVKRRLLKEEKVLENLDSILTPVGLLKRCNSATNFTTTRSGRLSLPPLARWQGQKYIISTESNTLTVGFDSNGAEKALLNDTNKFMKLNKSLQKSLYHKSLSKSILESPNSSLISNVGKKQQNLDCPHEKATITGIDKNSQNRIISNRKSKSPRKPDQQKSILKQKGNFPPAQKEKCIGVTSSLCLNSSTKLNSPRVHLVDCVKKARGTQLMKENTSPINVSTVKKRGMPKTNSSSSLKRSTKKDAFDTSVFTSPTSESIMDCSIVLRNRSIERGIHHGNTSNTKREKCNVPKSPVMNNQGKNIREGKDQKQTYADAQKSRSMRRNPGDAHRCQSEENNLGKTIYDGKGQKQRFREACKSNKEEMTCNKKELKQRSKGACKSRSTSFENEEGICAGSEEKSNRPSRKRKYYSSPVSDDTGYSTEEQSCLKLQQDSTPKSCGKEQARKRRKLSLSTVAENEQESSWTDHEKGLFEKALRSVDVNSPNLWSLVSNVVLSKSDNECRKFHVSYLEMKTQKGLERKKVSRKSSGRQKGEPVRGGKGTMKRREDIREFLKEQDEGYEDSLLEGTPFVSRKLPMPIMSNIDFDKDDSKIFGCGHNFFTPMNKNGKFGTPATNLRARQASTRKTPSNIVTNYSVTDTPINVDRQIFDKYTLNFMNKPKTNRKESDSNGSEIEEENTSKVDLKKLPSKTIFSPSIMVYDEERQIEDEDEEEKNPFIFYWNEDEN